MRRGTPRQKYATKVGDEFDQWKVEEVIGTRSRCRCRCGDGEQWVLSYYLHIGRSTRCRACAAKASGATRTTMPWRHQYPKSIVRTVYDALNRCSDAGGEKQKHWGSRGIRVCPEWLNDPAKFCEYLMALPGWDDPDLIIDRKDNDKGYEPGNLRWVTYSVSLHNRRPYRKRPHSEGAKQRIAAAVRAAWELKRGTA